MIIEESLQEHGYEGIILFKNPDFVEAFVGVSIDGRAVYDYDLMVMSLCKHDNMSVEEAAEFISYNTIRALPYAGPNCPIILQQLATEHVQ